MHQQVSITHNFVWHTVETVSAVLFPLIAFPYASRVIMADGIGQVQFYKSIINYVVLLTSLGIPMYGIREIARVRDNTIEMARTAAEILSLNLLLTLGGYVIVAVLCFTVGRIQVNLPLFLIMSTSILLTALGCPWFFRGLEDFRFLAIRGLVVRVAALVFLFVFVRTRDDLLLYGVYSVAGALGGSLLSFFGLRGYGLGPAFRAGDLHIWRHLRPMLAVFAFNAAVTVYVNIDAVMLGFMNDNISVGYFTAATKVVFVLVTLVTSLSAVMLPRASYLVGQGRQEEFASLSQKSYNVILWCGLPLCAGVAVMASTIICLFCGDGYAPAVLTLQVLAPIIVVKGVGNMVGRQVLYPQGKISAVTLCTCMGLAVNILLNLLLIPRYEQNGAAVSTVISECVILLFIILIGRRIIPFHLLDRSALGYLFASLLMAALCVWMLRVIPGVWARFLLIPPAGAMLYAGLMLLGKDMLTLELFRTIRERLPLWK